MYLSTFFFTNNSSLKLTSRFISPAGNLVHKNEKKAKKIKIKNKPQQKVGSFLVSQVSLNTTIRRNTFRIENTVLI